MNYLPTRRTSYLFILTALVIIFAVGAYRVIGKVDTSRFSLPSAQKTTKIVSEESVVIDIVKNMSPSVVSIAVEQRAINPLLGGSDTENGIGTGFVIRQDGLILTNKHVVSDTQVKYLAIIRDEKGEEKKYTVTAVHRDPFNDLAIVKVDATGLKPAELGDSNNLQVGQLVVAIGNALGRFNNTVTTGVISGLGRGVAPIDPTTGIAEQLDNLIQTDAAINPGNSGGPLVNSAGQVIGINTAVAGAQNIGFALPVNVGKDLIDSFEKNGGKISRPFLGVRYTHINKNVAIINQVPEGDFVREVVSNSEADKAGVKVGDIIVLADGQKLTTDNSLSSVIRSKKVGDSIKLNIWRDEKTFDVDVKLGASEG